MRNVLFAVPYVALPYLTSVEWRHFIERPSTLMSFARIPYPLILYFLFFLDFSTAIIGLKFAARDEAHDGRERIDQRQDFAHGRGIYLNARVSCYSRITPGSE